MSEQWIAILVTLICALTVHVSIFLWWRRKWGVLGRFSWARPEAVTRATVISDECEPLGNAAGRGANGAPASSPGQRLVASEVEMERFAALQAVDGDRKNLRDSGGDPANQGPTG